MSYNPILINGIECNQQFKINQLQTLNDLFSNDIDIYGIDTTILYENYHFNKQNNHFDYFNIFKNQEYPFHIDYFNKSNKEIWINLSIKTNKPFSQHKDDIHFILSRCFGDKISIDNLVNFSSDISINNKTKNKSSNELGTLNIQNYWLGHDCSTCGGDFAEGYNVSLLTNNDIELIIDFVAYPHCYNSFQFSDTECMGFIYSILGGEQHNLFKLKHELEPFTLQKRSMDLNQYKCSGCIHDNCYCGSYHFDSVAWIKYFEHFGWKVNFDYN